MKLVLITLAFAVVFVLIAGIFLMGIGGNANKKYGNKLMIARVGLQGAILLLLAMIYFFGA